MQTAAKAESPPLAETRIRLPRPEWLISTRPPQLLNSTLHWASTLDNYDFRSGSRCSSKERDAETGLDFFESRYYSSAQGRFTSPDEFKGGFLDAFSGATAFQPGPLPYADIGDPQTLNKYAYVRNNPLRYKDPDGHDLLDILFGRVQPPPTPAAPGLPKGIPLDSPKAAPGNIGYKVGVPDASGELNSTVNCIAACYKGAITVTSTTEDTPVHPEGTPHRLGNAMDVVVQPGDEPKVLQCAANCGAKYGLDERKHPSQNATAPHVHIQLTPGIGGAKGDLPPATPPNVQPPPKKEDQQKQENPQ